jgi:hypothetical protein
MVKVKAKPKRRPTRHYKDSPPLGRPITTEYDPDLIRSLAAVGCPIYEIAAQCGFSEGNFHNLKKKYPGIQKAIDEGKSELHKVLRKKQVELALEGNVQMLIHLGKVELGQNDKIELNQNIKAEVEYEVRFGEAIEKSDQTSEASSSTVNRRKRSS